MNKIYELMPDIQGEEMMFLQNITKDYDEDKLRNFAHMYRARRKDPQIILLLCVVGFFGVAGIHRMVLNQIGMGIVYFFYCRPLPDWHHCGFSELQKKPDVTSIDK